MTPPTRSRPLIVVDGNVLGRQRTGDESYVQNLLRELHELTNDREPIDFGTMTSREDLVPTGIRAYALRSRSQVMRLVIQAPHLLKEISPDLAHFQYVVPPGFKGRSIVTVHDVAFAEYPYAPFTDRLALRMLVPRSMRRSALVLTVSEWTRSRIIDRFGIRSDRIVVTPNGVDPAFTARGPAAGGTPYLLFVGALEPRKDPLVAIQALARLGDDVRLVMVGPPKRAAGRARRAIARWGLEHQVDMRGYVSKDELARLYRGALCFVFPSRYEGFGLPILEAMACGTPVVTTTAGSIPEVAGSAAVLVEPGNPEALADGIRRALRQSDAFRTAGLARAAQFSWAETARRTLEAYRKALS